MTTLNTLADNKGARKTRMRVGRGIGSGKGKTCGRGLKGQKSRSGVAINGFEGGQMPIYRRLPKRGFNNYNRKEFELVNLAVLEDFVARKKLDAKKPVNVAALLEAGVVNGNKDGVKLLAKGELKTKLTIEVDAASEAAIKAVEKTGGTVTIAPAPKAEKAEKADTKAEKKPSKKSKKAA